MYALIKISGFSFCCLVKSKKKTFVRRSVLQFLQASGLAVHPWMDMLEQVDKGCITH